MHMEIESEVEMVRNEKENFRHMTEREKQLKIKSREKDQEGEELKKNLSESKDKAFTLQKLNTSLADERDRLK